MGFSTYSALSQDAHVDGYINMVYSTDCISIYRLGKYNIVIIVYERLKFKRSDGRKFAAELGRIAINVII